MPSQRPRPNSEIPFHISARCANKEWFHIPMEETWSICSDFLHFIHHAESIRIHNFVLMNNHFHLIASTPQANLGRAMGYFMRETSREFGRVSGRINRIYGRPYHASLLNSYHYYLNAYKYVYRNPVDAGLCHRAEEYRFSTLHSLLGQSHTIIPVLEDTLLHGDVERELNWINTSYPEEQIRQTIRKALRRRVFVFPKVRGKPHPMESKLY